MTNRTVTWSVGPQDSSTILGRLRILAARRRFAGRAHLRDLNRITS